MKILRNENITWIEFDVKRKMKRTFSEGKLEKYIFGEEYKQRPKEHKTFLQWMVRDAKKEIKLQQAKRLIRIAEGETDTEFLDHIYGADFSWQRLNEAEAKLAEGNYLQTAEEFAYRKEWMARWSYYEATIYNSDKSKDIRTLLWDDEYKFKTYGYDWDKHTGVLEYDDIPAAMDKEALKEFRQKWS
jgi:hypothetical protein